MRILPKSNIENRKAHGPHSKIIDKTPIQMYDVDTLKRFSRFAGDVLRHVPDFSFIRGLCHRDLFSYTLKRKREIGHARPRSDAFGERNFFLRFPISSNLVSELTVFETKGSLIHRLMSNFLPFETKDMPTRWEKGARYAGTI